MESLICLLGAIERGSLGYCIYWLKRRSNQNQINGVISSDTLLKFGITQVTPLMMSVYCKQYQITEALIRAPGINPMKTVKDTHNHDVTIHDLMTRIRILKISDANGLDRYEKLINSVSTRGSRLEINTPHNDVVNFNRKSDFPNKATTLIKEKDILESEQSEFEDPGIPP